MTEETNPEQCLVSVEDTFESAKAARLIAKHRWESAKGKLHMELMARREAGETLTIEDMKAIKAAAIDNVPDVRSAYLAFIAADSDYRGAKVAYEASVRQYWDNKPLRLK